MATLKNEATNMLSFMIIMTQMGKGVKSGKPLPEKKMQKNSGRKSSIKRSGIHS